MQKDFHYYGIGFLARAAGFTEQDALTIAYSSQYVDDATENEPIRVGQMIFDPVRTAHYGLKALNWSTQKRVYIPFHFLPPNKSIRSPDDFITRPNSSFGKEIFMRACQEKDKLLRLISIGISLHTLADTWSHQNFSGNETQINDVEKIIYYNSSGASQYPLWENIYLDFLPKIGHAQAGNYPDYPFLKWEYTSSTGGTIQRDNKTEFLNSAKEIYSLLCGIGSEPCPWNQIETTIDDLLSFPEIDQDERCEKWKKKYLKMFDNNENYEYDKDKWRKDALNPHDPQDIKWDKYKPSDFEQLSFPMIDGFYDTPWVKFHRAALRQRNFVLENLL